MANGKWVNRMGIEDRTPNHPTSNPNTETLNTVAEETKRRKDGAERFLPERRIVAEPGGVATKLQAEYTAETAKALDRKITDRKMGANDTQKGGSNLTTDKTGFTRMGRTERGREDTNFTN
jgi:hypothetical protein